MARKAKTPAPTKMIALKGLDHNFQCRDFRFEVGKTYHAEGEIEPCKNGFHSCPESEPFAVWEYYSPASEVGMARYAVVEIGDEVVPKENKFASAEITIKAEISLPEFIQRTVDWIVKNAQDKKIETGDRSAATNTGNQSAATNTGNQSAATNTGYRSAAEVSGAHSVAVASGYASRARACAGSAIFICERNVDGELLAVFAGIAGRDGIEPDAWYQLIDGKPTKQSQAA